MMTDNSDPVYPVKALSTHEYHGMTIRQYYAGQALAGICGSMARVSPRRNESQAQADARWSFERADAMIAEGEKP